MHIWPQTFYLYDRGLPISDNFSGFPQTPQAKLRYHLRAYFLKQYYPLSPGKADTNLSGQIKCLNTGLLHINSSLIMVNYILMEITALWIEDSGGGGDCDKYDDALEARDSRSRRK